MTESGTLLFHHVDIRDLSRSDAIEILQNADHCGMESNISLQRLLLPFGDGANSRSGAPQ